MKLVNENDKVEVGKFCKLLRGMVIQPLGSTILTEIVRIITTSKCSECIIMTWYASKVNPNTTITIHPFVKDIVFKVVSGKFQNNDSSGPNHIFECFPNYQTDQCTSLESRNDTSTTCDKCHEEVKVRTLFNSFYIGCNC